ncbi:hypothetical protein GmHk_06G016786 [Glycine max]|nr:hypothetical protein GmHk_06G016786 [Glycine max]
MNSLLRCEIKEFGDELLKASDRLIQAARHWKGSSAVNHQRFPLIGHQSITLKGLGPQSTVVDLKRMGQWSEKSLSSTNWVESGHWISQSSERRNLSSLLIAVPLGLTQVKFLPTDLTSSKAISEIQELNSEIQDEFPTD